MRPVHRIKHVVDLQGATAIDGNALFTLIEAKDAPVLANVDEVETGSKVNALYMKVEAVCTSDTASPTNFYMMVMKNPGGNLVFNDPNVIGSDDNKRYVIHQEMLMLQPDGGALGGNPRVVFNGVIVIPRGYRRFGPNDKLQIEFHTPAITSNMCVQAHYKEFR